MATLYTLTGVYADLLARLEAAETKEETEAIWAEMDAIGGDITEKAEAYARIMQSKKAEAEAYKAEKDRLAAKQKTAENVAERLKSRLLDSMLLLGVKDIQTGIGKWRVQLNPPSCQVIDNDKIPTEYHIPQPDIIDKAAILKHYKTTGELIPGTEITQGQSIRFK